MMGEFRSRFRLASGLSALVFLCALGCEDEQAGGESSVDAAAASAMDGAVAASVAPEAGAGGRIAEALAPADWADPDQGAMSLRADECCTEPGQADQCWNQDATDDGAACNVNGDCASGSCDLALKLCNCTTDAQCGQGICTDAGKCGPSYCNGYKICSCWGGCVWWHANESYTPQAACEASSLYCCDGGYPVDPTAQGFCSNVANCGGGECGAATDCTAQVGNVCIQAQCLDETCFYPAIDTGNCAPVMNPDQTWADQEPPCCCNVDADCPTLPCVDDVYCDLNSSSEFFHQCVFTWAAAGSSCPGEGSDPLAVDDACGTWHCTAAHECVEIWHDGAACNADSNGCTQNDSCLSGGCVAGLNVNCSDDNVCTGPDACVNVPSPPLHNGYNCVNPPRPNANAEVYGYLDTAPCADRFCVNGMMGPPVAVNCDAQDNVCNNWECDPLGPEDNCTNSMLIGAACNADSNLCTTPDTCTDGGGGTANCTAGPAVVCAPTGSPCLGATCNPLTGNCDVTPINNGGACNQDNNPCTIGTCNAGSCVEIPVNCSAMSNQCNNGVCQPSGSTYTCVAAPIANGTLCNADSNGCTVNDSCQNGTCTAGAPYVCNDSNVCTSDACQSTGNNTRTCNYTNLPSTTACDFDTNGCTVGDHCNGLGACVAGTAVTPAACLSALGANVDCNNGLCVSTGATTYNCTAVPKSPVPAAGSCNNDNNGCTLDTCVASGNPSIGATCNAGALRNCTGLNILPCQTGVCQASSNYNSSCVASYAAASTACNFDSNGCTVGDHCSGTSSACVAGTPATCNDSNVCTTDACSSTSSTTYNCVYTPISNCCTTNAQCASFACPSPLPTVGCSTPTCNTTTNQCYCLNSALNTPCTGIDPGLYPPNCYDGFCNSTGTCQPLQHPAFNNLCSDLFVAPGGTVVDTAHDGYIGSISNTGTIAAGPDATVSAGTLAITGSTLCANNNYKSTGNYCTESNGVTPLGNGGRDLVYAFRYQTNSASQFQLYSYIIKVQANYNVSIYTRSDIDTAAQCPEGNNPTNDTGSWNFLSSTCNYPYDDNIAPTYLPPVVEDECSSSGNTYFGQDCCNPCTQGSTCGYKWCQRGYPDGCNMCVVGGCTGIWNYPADPFNCTSTLPAGPGYSTYTSMATTMISPKGATDGTWRTVFIVVDGTSSTTGNFYLTIERKPWWSSPCDRVNDDPRVYDVTLPGTAGSTYLGTLQNVVNSMHSSSGPCAGYDCWGWSGKTVCHGAGTANQFWPNEEHFKIHRTAAQGNMTYCVETDESIAGAADLVLALWRRTYSGVTTVCDETYSDIGCWRNNSGGNVKYQFTANAGELYMLAFSTYGWLNAPCTSNCNYKITIREGACPFTCASPAGGTAGADFYMNTTAYTNANFGNGTITTSSGDNHNPGYDGHDHVWRFYNNTGSTVAVEFKMVPTTGGDAMLALYTCDYGSLLFVRDVGGGGVTETYTYNLPPSANPYYVVADTYGASTAALGGYELWAKWGTPTCPTGASFVSQSVPATMDAGQTYAVSVTMNNTSTTTWPAGGEIRLGSQNPQDNTNWGLGRVNLSASVPPGATHTFNFNVTAPATPGTYNFQWRMVFDGVCWFGTQTTNVAVTVPPPPGPATCSEALLLLPGGGFFGFETGNDGFDMNGDWLRNSYYARTGSWSMDYFWPSGSYGNNKNHRTAFNSSYDLSACSGSTLRIQFYVYGRAETNYDFLYPECSGDGGATWQIMTPGITGTWSPWTYFERTIPTACKTSTSRMGFRFYSDGSISYQGYLLDDIRMYIP